MNVTKETIKETIKDLSVEEFKSMMMSVVSEYFQKVFTPTTNKKPKSRSARAKFAKKYPDINLPPGVMKSYFMWSKDEKQTNEKKWKEHFDSLIDEHEITHKLNANDELVWFQQPVFNRLGKWDGKLYKTELKKIDGKSTREPIQYNLKKYESDLWKEQKGNDKTINKYELRFKEDEKREKEAWDEFEKAHPNEYKDFIINCGGRDPRAKKRKTNTRKKTNGGKKKKSSKKKISRASLEDITNDISDSDDDLNYAI